MNIVEVMRLPLSVDLSGFVKLLQRLQIPHRVSEEGEVQVLWAPETLSLIHISEPTRLHKVSRMPSSA